MTEYIGVTQFAACFLSVYLFSVVTLWFNVDISCSKNGILR